MRSALVTGGAGFVGSHLVDALVARGTRATVLDDLSTGRWENVTPRATLIVGSVTDERAVTAALEIAEPDVVFHLAAQIDVRRAVSDPAHDAAVNLIGTVTVLEAAQRAGVRRFVLASTGGAIYGEAGIVPTPETATPHPGSPYAASKTAAEVYLDLYRELHGLSSLTLRLANVYGPRQDPRGEAGVIAIFCAAAAAGMAVTIYGDGEQTRDFVYVGDVVEAFLAAGATHRCGCCNIATGRETSVRELARLLELDAGYAPARAGEVRRSCLDPAYAAELLGWRPRTALPDGLQWTLTSMARATPRARVASASP